MTTGIKRTTLIGAILLGGLSLPLSVIASDAITSSISALSVVDRNELESRINDIANKVANSKPYFDDDPQPVHISASFDPAAESLILHADERLGPVSGYSSMEDLQSDVQDAIWPLLEMIPSFRGIDWRYGGKDMYFWFPQDRPANAPTRKKRAAINPGGGSVLVSPGHGYYYHHGYKDWRPQRAAHNGILEDEITLRYGIFLQTYLIVSGYQVTGARMAPIIKHEPSGQFFQNMAARYHFEQLMPDRPDIWHSLPESVKTTREYDEDIRSRPLYANDLNVDAVFHLHTNASDNASARGTKVFVQPDRPESARLGRMALCYMKEHIRALNRYQDFPVDQSPIPKNHGENRLAAMPSIIVEVGFHTNAEDAAALNDFMFQGASMKGLAKGYRLFREGVDDCEDFVLEVPEKVSGLLHEAVSIPVSKKTGHPDFPVQIDATPVNCVENQPCRSSYASAFNQDELDGLRLVYHCLDEDVERSPFTMSVVGRDFEQIKSDPVNVTITCIRPPEPQTS